MKFMRDVILWRGALGRGLTKLLIPMWERWRCTKGAERGGPKIGAAWISYTHAQRGAGPSINDKISMCLTEHLFVVK